jgi:hypothetical protein
VAVPCARAAPCACFWLLGAAGVFAPAAAEGWLAEECLGAGRRGRGSFGPVCLSDRGVGVGHDIFPDIVAVVESAVRNPRHQDLSIASIYILQSVARRLADSKPEVRSSTRETRHSQQAPEL